MPKTVVIPDLHRVASALCLTLLALPIHRNLTWMTLTKPGVGHINPLALLLWAWHVNIASEPRKTELSHVDRPAAMLGVFGGGEMTARAFPERLVPAPALRRRTVLASCLLPKLER